MLIFETQVFSFPLLGVSQLRASEVGRRTERQPGEPRLEDSSPPG